MPQRETARPAGLFGHSRPLRSCSGRAAAEPIVVLGRELRRHLRKRAARKLARAAVAPFACALIVRLIFGGGPLFASEQGRVWLGAAADCTRRGHGAMARGAARTPSRCRVVGEAGVGARTFSVGMLCVSAHITVSRCRPLCRKNSQHRSQTRARTVLRAQREMTSPFADGAQVGKPKLPLTLENVELVLDELRPYLQKDGGDCRVIELEGPILRLEMQGSCSSCSSSAITVKMGIERTLLDRIPEIYEVVAEMPGSVTPTEEGIDKVLGTIQPFLSASGGTIELVELDLGEGVNPQPTITLGMTGPPQRNASVKKEVLRRMRHTYGQALIEIVGDEDR